MSSKIKPLASEHMSSTTWGQRLQNARVTQRIRATTLAKAVGVSTATISDWESGKIKQMRGFNLERVCDALGIRREWLVYGEGEMLACRDDAATPPMSDFPPIIIELIDLTRHLADFQLQELFDHVQQTVQRNQEIAQRICQSKQ